MKNRLSEILIELRIKQKELAQEAGISPATLSLIISGKRAASLPMQMHILSAINLLRGQEFNLQDLFPTGEEDLPDEVPLSHGDYGFDPLHTPPSMADLESEVYEPDDSDDLDEDLIDSTAVDMPSFTVWIDPGTAKRKDVQELFAAMSELQRFMGGDGMTFLTSDKESYQMEVAQ